MKLDKIDIKILKELDKNPKITTIQLAKTCLISQQVADYRLKNLKNKEVITNFPTIINFFKIGYFAHMLLLKSNPLPESDKNILNEYIQKESNIYAAKKTGGNYDYSIIYLVKTYEELDNHLNKLFSTFDFFLDYEVYPITEISYYHYKMLKIKNNEKLTIAQFPEIEKIDELDFDILESISKDCRISNLEVGKKLKVNYNTIKNRIENLTKKEIILGYKITINPNAQDLQHFNLLISLDKYSKKEEAKLESFCNNHEDIIYVAHLLGGIWTFNIGVQTKSLETLQKILGEVRSIFKIIDEIIVVPIFEEIRKDTFPMMKILK